MGEKSTAPVQKRKISKKASSAQPSDSLAMKIAQAENRIQEINEDMKKLSDEKAQLQANMESLYKELGEKIFKK